MKEEAQKRLQHQATGEQAENCPGGIEEYGHE